MKRNKNATCATCPYWYKIANETKFNIGECRVTGPDSHSTDHLMGHTGKKGWYTGVVFPKTMEDVWCGAYPNFLTSE